MNFAPFKKVPCREKNLRVQPATRIVVAPIVSFSPRKIKQRSFISVIFWNGRLGNNIIQISDVLYYAKKNDMIPAFPNHSILNFEKNDNYLYSTKRIGWGIDEYISWKERSNLLKQFLPNHLPFIRNVPSLKSDIMVIHIRSGDIFGGYNCSFYWQPPLSMYQKIIEKMNPSLIYIVTEADKKNPVIKPLLSQYGTRIKIQTAKLADDVRLLLSAKTLVLSRSSFSMVFALLSHNLENVFVMDVNCSNNAEYNCNYMKITSDGIPDQWKNVYLCSFPNYIESWQNTPENLSKMINYPKEKIVITKLK